MTERPLPPRPTLCLASPKVLCGRLRYKLLRRLLLLLHLHLLRAQPQLLLFQLQLHLPCCPPEVMRPGRQGLTGAQVKQFGYL